MSRRPGSVRPRPDRSPRRSAPRPAPAPGARPARPPRPAWPGRRCPAAGTVRRGQPGHRRARVDDARSVHQLRARPVAGDRDRHPLGDVDRHRVRPARDPPGPTRRPAAGPPGGRPRQVDRGQRAAGRRPAAAPSTSRTGTVAVPVTRTSSHVGQPEVVEQDAPGQAEPDEQQQADQRSGEPAPPVLRDGRRARRGGAARRAALSGAAPAASGPLPPLQLQQDLRGEHGDVTGAHGDHEVAAPRDAGHHGRHLRPARHVVHPLRRAG